MDNSVRRQRSVFPDELLQTEARKIFHDAIKSSVVRVPVVENLDRIRMGQRCRDLHFALESPKVRRIAGPLGSNQLNGARPAQKQVLGEIDLAHAPSSEALL